MSFIRLAVSIWASFVVRVSPLVAIVVATPMILKHPVVSSLIPWLSATFAIVASAAAGFLARLVPAVGKAYPWSRVALAGLAGWFIAGWTGMEAKYALEQVAKGQPFEINATLEHLSLLNAATLLVAFLVLGARRDHGARTLLRPNRG